MAMWNNQMVISQVLLETSDPSSDRLEENAEFQKVIEEQSQTQSLLKEVTRRSAASWAGWNMEGFSMFFHS